MRFYNFRGGIYRDWICILPSIVVRLNQLEYSPKNIAIEVHFLIFHCRWLWLQKNW